MLPRVSFMDSSSQGRYLETGDNIPVLQEHGGSQEDPLTQLILGTASAGSPRWGEVPR